MATLREGVRATVTRIMAKQILALIFAAIVCTELSIAQQNVNSFRGGHLTWRFLKQTDKISIDYTLFYDISGSEANQCTENAIKNKDLIRTGIPIFLWNTDPYNTNEIPRVIGRVSFYCTLKDEDFMKRIVGEFKGFEFMPVRTKFYIGFTDSVIDKPIFTYVDLTVRRDTNRVNSPPKIMIFPQYQVDERGDNKIVINAVDKDNDYIKCTDLASKKIMENCNLIVSSKIPSGYYQGWIMVEDFRNSNSKETFSKTILQFDVRKLDSRPSDLKPELSIKDHQECLFTNGFNNDWKRSINIKYNPDRLKLFEPKFLAPVGTKSIVNFKTGEVKLDMVWKPKEKAEGKYMLCFFVAGMERSTQKLHVSRTKCWFLNVGQNANSLERNFIYPKHNSQAPKLLDRFEFKIHGAFTKPTSRVSTYLIVRKQSPSAVQYTINIATEAKYEITQDNRLIIRSKKIKSLEPGTYSVSTYGAIYVPEAQCIGSGIVSNSDWVFTVGDDNRNGEVTTTEATTKHQDHHQSTRVPKPLLRLVKSVVLDTIKTWTQGWRVSFSVKPNSQSEYYRNIFHFTTGDNCCDAGNRIPAIYQEPGSNRILIISSVDNRPNYPFRTPELSNDRFTDIVVMQSKADDEDNYRFKIFFDGKEEVNVVNKNPQQFNDVKVYASNPWQPIADVEIKSFDYRVLDRVVRDSKQTTTTQSTTIKSTRMSSTTMSTTPSTTTTTTTRRPRRNSTISTMRKEDNSNRIQPTQRRGSINDVLDFQSASLQGPEIKSEDTPKHKSVLDCQENKMTFNFQPDTNANNEIEKVTLDYDWCKLRYNRASNTYEITTNYDQCGTYVKENEEFILFKNLARVFYKDMTTQDSMITRSSVMNIALECRMKKTAMHSIKGKKEDESGITTGQQAVEFHDYAHGYGAFRIDFQVYKTQNYNHSYGTQEFPIYLAISNRIYFELSMDREDLNLMPNACYATKGRYHQERPRYYLVDERCPKDATYRQHGKTNDNTFRFSVQAFTMKNGGDSFYVHCQSYVCNDKNRENCRFGCENGRGRQRRSLEMKESILKDDGFVTSTLEIKIKGDKIYTNLHMNKKDEPAENDTMKYLHFLQIPIGLVIIGAVYMAWRCIKARKMSEETKQ